MAINPSLLVSAAMLQDVLIDNVTDLPMSNGTITLYQDNARTTLKNWYEQTGSPGAYTYTTLPNPMTLSAAGTITDGSGNDVIPFFYPYSEADETISQTYYIVVVDSNGQSQFTRQNFPFGAYTAITPISNDGATLKNYIFNNVFWRNIGTVTVTNSLNSTLSPSAHDGFSMPDMQFFKQATGATDVITFTKFSAGQFLNPPSVNPQNLDVTPEFFMNFTCSGTGTETFKYVQWPISLHLLTLESAPAIITLFARCRSSGGSLGNVISISILQFTGTGTSSPAVIPLQTFTLPITASSTSPFTKCITNAFTFPSAVGLTLGGGGDDAYYLQVGFTTGVTFSIDIAKPCLYIGNETPANELQVYDEVDAIINSARTGDTRISINSFYPFGWVPMNNGTIGNPSSNATTRANQDTFQLFSLLWSIAKPYDTGGGSHSNQICQMFNSAGSTIDFGASAIVDFNANNALALTNMFGQVIMGTVPISALLSTFSQTITASNSGGNLLITLPSNTTLFVGQPIAFTTTGSLPGGLTANHIFYVASPTTNTFLVTSSFANAIAGAFIPFVSSGSNSSVTFEITGSTTGEYDHTQLIAELAAHTHPAAANLFVETGPGAITFTGNTSSFTSNATTGSTGSSAPFNIIQPSTFYNIYMKL